MADCLVKLRDKDVKGAILPLKIPEDNLVEDLRRWIQTRGFSVGKEESKSKLVKRISDLQTSGLDRFIVDPDGTLTYAIVEDHVKTKLSNVPPPVLNNWTKDMSVTPEKFCYSNLYEYLVKRTVTILNVKNSDSDEETEEFDLPVAEKPLKKGFNFYGSGNVKDIRFCPVNNVIHVKASVMASMRSTVYIVSIVLETDTAFVLTARCQCVAGTGGKCNHVAGVLFALLDYREISRGITSPTDKPQKWHMPSRQSKRSLKPANTGKHQVKKHIFGRDIKKMRPLEEYESHVTVKDPVVDYNYLKSNLHTVSHKMAISQILLSTSSSSQEDDNDAEIENMSPEEIIMNELKVTAEEKADIEARTRGQADSLEWFRAKKGRISASIAKDCCGKGNPALKVKKIITIGRPGQVKSEHIKYGLENEELAVQKFVNQMTINGHSCIVRRCGLFVQGDEGILAATPDRLAIIDGKEVVLEVKCLSAS